MYVCTYRFKDGFRDNVSDVFEYWLECTFQPVIGNWGKYEKERSVSSTRGAGWEERIVGLTREVGCGG